MGGGTLEITQEDFNNLAGKNGLIAIKSCGQIINTSSISRILPKEDEDQLSDKKDQVEGMLHDGTPVVRYFGRWYTADVLDDNGKPYQVCDPSYYLEIARDCVPNHNEYEKIKHLSRNERLKLILEKNGEEEMTERISSGFKKIVN